MTNTKRVCSAHSIPQHSMSRPTCQGSGCRCQSSSARRPECDAGLGIDFGMAWRLQLQCYRNRSLLSKCRWRCHGHLMANLLSGGEGLEGTRLRAISTDHEVLFDVPQPTYLDISGLQNARSRSRSMHRILLEAAYHDNRAAFPAASSQCPSVEGCLKPHGILCPHRTTICLPQGTTVADEDCSSFLQTIKDTNATCKTALICSDQSLWMSCTDSGVSGNHVSGCTMPPALASRSKYMVFSMHRIAFVATLATVYTLHTVACQSHDLSHFGRVTTVFLTVAEVQPPTTDHMHMLDSTQHMTGAPFSLGAWAISRIT